MPVNKTVSTLRKILTLLNNIYQIRTKCQLLVYVIPLNKFSHLFLTAIVCGDKIITPNFQMRTLWFIKIK